MQCSMLKSKPYESITNDRTNLDCGGGRGNLFLKGQGARRHVIEVLETLFKRMSM